VENSETPTKNASGSRVETIGRVAGDLKVTDIAPENLKDQVPVIILPGWGETPATHKDSAEIVAKEGRRAITFQVPRIGGAEKQDEHHQSEYNKARALIDTLNKKEIKQVDIIAHSEGALSAIIAAEIFAQERQPQRIRNIVFVEPVGLIGRDNLAKLVGRWGAMMTKDIGRFVKGSLKDKGNMARAFNEANRYVVSNPIKTVSEARQISSSDIYDSLTHLRELGIQTSVIHAVDDSLFPMEKVMETVKEKGGMDTAGFYSVKGDHREISIHPEKYASLAVNALNDLAKQKT